jgi:hypothetical protein
MSVLSTKIQANCQLSGVEILKNFSVTNLISGLPTSICCEVFSLYIDNVKNSCLKAE